MAAPTSLTCVLTIAGSDSGAGAGLQADARTIQALGAYAATAVTAVTAQGPSGIRAWQAMSPALVAAQIGAVLTPLRVRAVKTGLLPSGAVVRAVARALGETVAPLVIDPVLGSTSGTRFLSAAGLVVLRRVLLPRATVITPNWPEAAALTGRPVRSAAQAREAARQLAGDYGCAALVKGGHGTGPICRDWLARADGSLLEFGGDRIATRHTHGTGCVLSAALATHLAHGVPLAEAVQRAHLFLRAALADGRHRDWTGAGPAYAGPGVTASGTLPPGRSHSSRRPR